MAFPFALYCREMGNNGSGAKSAADAVLDPATILQNENISVVKALVGDQQVLEDPLGKAIRSALSATLKARFGNAYGSSVLHFLWPKHTKTTTLVDIAAAMGKLLSLDQSADETFVSLFQNHDGFLETDDCLRFWKECCAACGLTEWSGTYTTQLSIAFDRADPKSICQWIDNNCPRLLAPLKLRTHKMLKSTHEYHGEFNCPKSTILSPFQMMLLQLALPIVYTAGMEQNPDESSQYHHHHSKNLTSHWRLLYASDNDGLSVSRFELKVLGYIGPTVMLVRLGGGGMQTGLFAVGVDEGWKHDTTSNWGSYNSAVIKVEPKFEFCASGPGMLYFNTKSRASPLGIQVGVDKKNLFFSIDGQFTNVISMEVWGCGSEEAHKSQVDLKKWEQRQVEKQLKVPLPGKWDENPDKELLLMAGVKMGCNQGPGGSD